MLLTETSILIVEDESPIRQLLIEILAEKFQCSAVDSASEALKIIDSQVVNLALVDLGLPGLSGLSLCRLIVNRSPCTVVIVISGETDKQSIEDAMKAGAVDYITKPFELARVLAAVERALGRNNPGAVA